MCQFISVRLAQFKIIISFTFAISQQKNLNCSNIYPLNKRDLWGKYGQLFSVKSLQAFYEYIYMKALQIVKTKRHSDRKESRYNSAVAVELHCPVQINSSLRHYSRSTDLAELRGWEDARGIKGRCRGRRRWTDRFARQKVGCPWWRYTKTKQKVSIREVVPLA